MRKLITMFMAIVLILSSSVCYAAEMNFTDVQKTDWLSKPSGADRKEYIFRISGWNF
jgi:hypothetical protein